ncbi:MAG: RNB domain-containing ribonuclease [Aquificota bacterium]|nr:RNB domain-containing ribonuclease [Aquificota bacterium]
MKERRKSLSEKQILDILTRSKKPLHFLQIAKALGLDKDGRKKLKKTLRKLKREGKVRVVGGKFTAEREEKVVGRVVPYPGGFGFLEVDEGKDLYIPPFEMAKVFAGDLVRAKVVEFRGKKEVRIERVIRRARQEIVGKVIKEEGTCRVVPLDDNVHQVLVLSRKDCSRVEDGTVVVARITQFPTERSPARAKVKEVIGHPEKRFIAIDLIIRKYNLPTGYPEDVMKEAEALPGDIPKEEIKRRRDLRDQICFTIDPERARDFDDAVAIETTEEGHYRLFVHIADVTYYLKGESALRQGSLQKGLYLLPSPTEPFTCFPRGSLRTFAV